MPDLFDIEDKVAIVTGASSGIGRHFALTLARAGAKVAAAARRTDELGKLVAEIAGFDGRAFPVSLDVTDAASIRDAVSTAETELGPIAILVNCAGVMVSKPFFEHSEADWDYVVGTNLKGAYLMAREVAQHMVRLGHGGSIINVVSFIGLTRYAAQITEYTAAKAGLTGLTGSMASELARNGIRVNAIAPGYIETDFNRDFLASEPGQALVKRIPQRRAGAPEDLDGALLLLASDASRFMTGSVIVVDGGHSVAHV